MNVLQIFPGKVWGGAEQYVLDLGNTLIAQGHNVWFLARRSRAVADRLCENMGVEFVPFMCRWDFRLAAKLTCLIKEKEIDVLHIHDTRFVPMAIVAKIRSHRNVRVVLTRHIARASRTGCLCRSFFKKLHAIIFVSHLAKMLWLEVNRWMPEELCHVVLNSVQQPPIAPVVVESLRERFTIPEGVPLILFTGRVRRSKGCEVLIRALAAISHIPFHVVFIGTCKPRNFSERLAELACRLKIGDRVSFYGFSHNVRQLICECDIGVAPSIVREACPLSPMEFMQAGKCVVATDNGAQCEYIESWKDGVLVPPADVDALAHVLERLLTDTNKRKQIGHEAKLKFDEMLNYSRFMKEILAVYR